MAEVNFTESDGHNLLQQMLQEIQQLELAHCSLRPSERETSVQTNVVLRYFLAVRNFNLTWDEVVQIGRNSLEYSFAEPPLKTKLLASYDSAVAAFETKYGGNDWSGKLAEPSISGYARRKLGIR